MSAGRASRIVVVVVLLLGSLWSGFSIGQYFATSEGEPPQVVLATWARDHRLGPVVAAAENFYYQYVHTTDTGGAPTLGAQVEPSLAPPPSPTPSQYTPPSIVIPHLNPPPTIQSPASDPVPGEGVWTPIGSTVATLPAMYAARVRPDSTYTSEMASLMWFDSKLVNFLFVPGYQEPGGPAPSGGALPEQYWSTVLANFNGAFRINDTQGGYMFDGVEINPLTDGAASAVLYKDGSMKVGMWGRDVGQSKNVVSVRQNLKLIVDGSVSAVSDQFSWGATTHGENLAWRSAVGVRADGSVVYVGSPGLSAASMADTLVRAGVVRAMVLDMNDWWVAGFYFTHAPDGAPICHKLDPNMAGECDRFLNSYKRDSFQVLARQGLTVGREGVALP